MIFIIFNDSVSEYSELFDTIINLLNIYQLLMKYSNSEKIKQNLLISLNYFAYNLFIYCCIFTISFIILATLFYMFREANAIEIEDEDFKGSCLRNSRKDELVRLENYKMVNANWDQHGEKIEGYCYNCLYK